jgi:hypothetical protein
MFAQLNYNAHSTSVTCQIEELPRDVKRVLRVQWKEFLHWLEDYQDEPRAGQSLPTQIYRNIA